MNDKIDRITDMILDRLEKQGYNPDREAVRKAVQKALEDVA